MKKTSGKRSDAENEKIIHLLFPEQVSLEAQQAQLGLLLHEQARLVVQQRALALESKRLVRALAKTIRSLQRERRGRRK